MYAAAGLFSTLMTSHPHDYQEGRGHQRGNRGTV